MPTVALTIVIYQAATFGLIGRVQCNLDRR